MKGIYLISPSVCYQIQNFVNNHLDIFWFIYKTLNLETLSLKLDKGLIASIENTFLKSIIKQWSEANPRHVGGPYFVLVQNSNFVASRKNEPVLTCLNSELTLVL